MLKTLKYLVLSSALLLLPMTSAHAAMTAQECADLFRANDANGDGSLAGPESVKFLEAITTASIKTRNAGILEMDEFNDACMKGTFDGME